MNAAATETRPARVICRRDLLVAAAFAVAAVGLMFDAWRDILRLGMRQEELSYVFLAPAVIGWIAIASRNRLIDCPLRREWAGLAILVVGWIVFFYGYVADPVLWRAGAVIVAVGAVVSALGLDALLRLWPAFAATIFLVPISPY